MGNYTARKTLARETTQMKTITITEELRDQLVEDLNKSVKKADEGLTEYRNYIATLEVFREQLLNKIAMLTTDPELPIQDARSNTSNQS